MRTFLSIILIIFTFTGLKAENDSTKIVYKFDVKENIAPAVWYKIQKAFIEADTLKADLFLIHMNTYGGTVVDADSIRTKILNSKIPVWVYIDNNAASAGALISIACDRIYMKQGANIGAATVVNQSGEKAPDKYQSYFRSTMRSTAQSHGADTIVSNGDTIVSWYRDPIMAEAMVDEDVYIAGIVDTGKILTFTAIEAQENNFCEGIYNSVGELLENEYHSDYELKTFKPSTVDKIIGFLTNPMVSGILIMGILGGIYFEMQSPGLGFPIVIAIIAAIAYFAPFYLEGLAANWEIILFVIGLILIVLEVFVIPGFGIAGALGITFTILSLTLSMLGNDNFNFEGVDTNSIIRALLTVTLSLFTGLILAIWLSKKMFTATSGPFHSLALNSFQDTAEGYISSNTNQKNMIGKKGVAQTVLRPSGKVFVEDDLWDAITEEGYIDKGTDICVVNQEAGQLIVEKK